MTFSYIIHLNFIFYQGTKEDIEEEVKRGKRMHTPKFPTCSNKDTDITSVIKEKRRLAEMDNPKVFKKYFFF